MEFRKGDIVHRKNGSLCLEKATVLENVTIKHLDKKRKIFISHGFCKIVFDSGGEYIYPTEELVKV